jgi:hypothetical protein
MAPNYLDQPQDMAQPMPSSPVTSMPQMGGDPVPPPNPEALKAVAMASDAAMSDIEQATVDATANHFNRDFAFKNSMGRAKEGLSVPQQQLADAQNAAS